MTKPITWTDFERVGIYAGTIVSAEPFPEARHPAYIVHVDFGPEFGILKSSAQITQRYETDELIGIQVLGVLNFPPKQIGPLMSEFLLTGCQDDEGRVVLATFQDPVRNGSRLM